MAFGNHVNNVEVLTHDKPIDSGLHILKRPSLEPNFWKSRRMKPAALQG